MATQDALMKLVTDSVQTASQAFNRLVGFSAKYAMAEAMVADLPAYRTLKLGSASRSWCAILFVDMRGSTNRAEQLGEQITYITMHALIPALAYLASDFGGFIVGYRGDGLFACFGIDETGINPEGLNKHQVVLRAAQSGQAMVEGVAQVVNPVLNAFKAQGDLRIGVGLDVGDVIFTRIGLQNAYEITAYANAVNKASKLASACEGYVHISRSADALFPTSPGGKVKTAPTTSDAYQLVFPSPILVPASPKVAALLEIIKS
jgi:adenylate cyclase